jgi:REP element-mobilizing transposase RayT
MTIARKRILDPRQRTWVHCTSRCVRRAFLCSGKHEHRRQWLEDRLAALVACFAAEVAAYAVMGNHLHVIVRMDPALPKQWQPIEVARRWLTIYPKKYLSDGTPQAPTEAEIATAANDWQRVDAWRKRLGELGWFMKALKEPFARRANREDDCTGTFWEGRFHSVPLLDQAALVACMAYVDLNPVRAKLATTPETSAFTSVRRRARTRTRRLAAARIRARQPAEAEHLLAQAGLSMAESTPQSAASDADADQAHQASDTDSDRWLTPLAACRVGDELANKRITTDDYLTLVDATGRLLKQGKRGAIPAELAPILARLDLTVEAWLETMLGWRMFAYSSALGHAATRSAEAARRGLKWICSRSPLFAPPAA